MTVPLIDLAKLANHSLAFETTAVALGFGGAGDIDRFIFQSYGKAVRELPAAGRLRGAIFLLEPPATPDALATVRDLKPVLVKINSEVSSSFLSLRLDLAGGATVAHSPSSGEKKSMTGGGWPAGFAQFLSSSTKKCVVWANGVTATVFLGGNIYIESPDVVAELPVGLPSTFQSLPWDDGAIVQEFALHKLNDTSPAGIWRLPRNFLLEPRPEKRISIALGEFLRNRMAGYVHHEDESQVDNEGRADIILHHYNGSRTIVEIKWSGKSLKSGKAQANTSAIEKALKENATEWLTTYGEEAFEAGIRQLAIYFSTAKYHHALLAVFDCNPPDASRPSGSVPVNPTHAAPHAIANFRSIRACVDPRKASTLSKI